jgi:uncharacterized protein YbjQ (UPF0145 family)
MEALFGLVSVSLLLVVGWYWGTRRAQFHLATLEARERELAHIFITNSKHFTSPSETPGRDPRMITTQLVWGVDRFQTFLAAFVQFFGGEVSSVGDVMARVRREAIVRMKAEAQAAGYNALANLRLDTAEIGDDPQRRQDLKIALLGSATAYRRQS